MRAKKASGITLLEFAMVAVIFAALIGTVLSALVYYEELAEKTVVETTIINMRAGLRWQVAAKTIAGSPAHTRADGHAGRP